MTDGFDIEKEAALISEFAHASAEGMDLLEARVREALRRCEDATREEDIELCRAQSGALERNGEPIVSVWAAGGCAIAIGRMVIERRRKREEGG